MNLQIRVSSWRNYRMTSNLVCTISMCLCTTLLLISRYKGIHAAYSKLFPAYASYFMGLFFYQMYSDKCIAK